MIETATIPADALAQQGGDDDTLEQIVAQVYGDHPLLVQDRMAAWRQAVAVFHDHFGSREPLLLIRAPGRANLLGKHSDFQGGHSNCICLPNELLLVASPRDDDRLVVHDTRPNLFPEMTTSVVDLMPAPLRSGSWNAYLVQASRTVEGTRWINYLASPFVLIQHKYPDLNVRGIDAVISGNIVTAAGLSSSSAINVAGMLAATAFNGIDRSWPELALWAGEAEWLSGTRGGAGDHSAILLTGLGKLAHMRTRPVVELQDFPFPDGCEVLAIYSGKPAVKSTVVNRNIYNSHSVSYRFGVEWLRRMGVLGLELEMVADLIDAKLGLSERQVLELIGQLPQRVTRSQLRQHLCLPDEVFHELTCSHDEPQAGYPLRRVCLYGVTEFSRSAMVPQLLGRRDVRELGRLMTISHDGDRVVSSSAGALRPYPGDVSDEDVRAMVRQACDRPGQFPTLPHIPGGYGNSCPELDQLVDCCLKIDGVYGAGLTGAGLGGHLLALTQPGVSASLTAALKRNYFDPLGVPCCVYRCPPMGGATMHWLV